MSSDLEDIKRKHTSQIDMLQGPLLKKILIFALPLAASSILQQLFNSVDVAVVGRFASSQALAAVGSNSSVISLMINLFVGISIGANVVIANYIGQQEKEKIQRAVHTVLVIAVISGILLLAIGLVIAKPILEAMGTPGDIIDLAVLYLRIYFLGMPFFMVYNFGAAILRSIGDTKRPLFCLIIAGVINAGLNLLLVIVFQMSVAGVAIATVISNVVSAATVLRILTHEKEPIRVYYKRLAIKKEILVRVLKIGVPAGVQSMVFSLSNVFIQAAINSFGSDAVAGSAAALNFEYFTYFMISAFSQATVTFTSQNYGARQLKRCRKIFWINLLMGSLFCGAMGIAFVLGRDLFIRFYTTDQEVIQYAAFRMTHVLFFELLTGTYEISGAAMRGLGYSMTPAIITILGSCAFRLIWVYTVFRSNADFGVLMSAYPISWVITGAVSLAAYFIIRKKVERKMPTVSIKV